MHKTVNGGGLPGFDNVGELVRAAGGPGGRSREGSPFAACTSDGG
ncbi:MAG: hypothetical protein ACRDO2_02900 [Nocardioidaceae bacterium]